MTVNNYIDQATFNIMQNKSEFKSTSDDFLNVNKLPDGDFVFRILSSIKSGWEVWNKNSSGKSVKMMFLPEDFDPAIRAAKESAPALMFFFQVYCVKEKTMRLMIVKQAALQKELLDIVKNMTDSIEMSTFIITKKATEKFPSYKLSQATTMSPEGESVPFKSPLPKEARDLFHSVTYDDMALYDGRSPFVRHAF